MAWHRKIEIERTPVRASTIHSLFQFDGDMKSKLDFSKQTADVREFLNLDTLLLDEAHRKYTCHLFEYRVQHSRRNERNLDGKALTATMRSIMISSTP